MKGVSPQRLAWSVATISALIMVPGIALSIAYAVRSSDYRVLPWHQALVPLSTVVYAILGALVAARQPRHPIGWLFLSVGLLYGLNALVIGYNLSVSASPEVALQPAPARLAIWAKQWIWMPGIFLPTTFVYLLFPEGRLPSPRWRLVAWSAGLGIAATVLGAALPPGSPNSLGATEPNTFVSQAAGSLLRGAVTGGAWLLLLGVLGSLAALGVRFRRSSGVERQQLKWLAYASGIMLASSVFGALVWAAWSDNQAVAELGIFFTRLVILTIGVAAAIAILRYRLYDIDLIINRTLVYGTLTAAVAGLYALVVGGTGVIFESSNSLASILLATVLVVLVFRPVRRQLQSAVDRLLPGDSAHSYREFSQLRRPRSEGTANIPTERASEKQSARQAGQWLRLARTAWYPTAAVALGILVAATPGYLSSPLLSVFEGYLVLEPGTPAYALMSAINPLSFLSAIVSLCLATLLFVKKPFDRMGLFLAYYLVAHGILFAGAIELLYPIWPAAPWVNSFVLLPLFSGPATIALISLFPDGHFVPPAARWLVLLSLVSLPVSAWSGSALLPFELSRLDPLFKVGVIVLWAALLCGAIFLQFYRYRHISSSSERQQTKWVVFGMTLALGLMAVSSLGWIRAFSLPEGTPVPVWLPVAMLVWTGSTLILPVSLTVAVLRYRLFDIDLLINRTLVYGALSALVVGIYVLVVGALGVLFRASGNLILALLATGLAAVLFQPLRERLQGGINHLMYGERHDPYAVLSRLGRRLEATLTPEATLPAVVETVAQALKLPYVAIALRQGDELEVVTSYGLPVENPVRLLLTYQSETIGQLILAQPAAGNSFTASEQRLLEDIAHQVSVAAHAVRLTNDLRRTAVELQRSREQLIAAREEERRRLRRDLHDGLGPALAAQRLKAGSARALLASEPETAVALLAELESGLAAALEDIRRLVYDLRPPVLDQLGLVGAIRESAARFSRRQEAAATSGPDRAPRISVEAPDHLPPLPAAAEVAAYRIVQEALTNVGQHARARSCRISLALDDRLHVTISDDGVGLPAERRAGVGLISMRERAEELGGSCVIVANPAGGTRIVVQLPVTGER